MSLEAIGLHKSYPTRSGPLPILIGVSLSLEPGQAVAIMGPSGSGKSTLLNILGTLDQPTTGTVTLDEQAPFQLPEAELARFRNQKIGFIFQDHHLLPQCSVLENVLLPTLVQSERHGLEARAKTLLDRVGLAARLDHRPAELSGGERQRVAVARALINQPRLLLADEPTGNLDGQNATAVGELLLEIARSEQVMLITVTHSAELASRFSRRYRMSEGQLKADS